jgi:preprotein translocase YajC subunit
VVSAHPPATEGDGVVTVGGLYGRIMSLNEEKVSLKVTDGVKVDVERSKVVRVLNRPAEPKKS